MAQTKPKVLITGCSDGGAGAALAIAFHKAGFYVYATARNLAKMENLRVKGIETLTLDVQSDSSIQACASYITAEAGSGSLDILVNNAGAQYVMPVADLNISEAKNIYDLNVFSHVAVTQAFLPLLLKAPSGRKMIVNHTSTAACIPIPFQSMYNSSKAAFAMVSDTMRLELQGFGIRVIDLRTGIVQTNLIKNMQEVKNPSLPKGSIYEPAKDVVERALKQETFKGQGTPADRWADEVVGDLMKKTPPSVIWRGDSALTVRISSVLPFGMFDGTLKRLTGLDTVEQIIRKQ
ncbi:NAD(P)-binding protein [Coniochaeta sp. PMI_546]|nr:NAD(P)-binding protein [Coniochaeta sp. PMI_546]